ncbi:MAG: squalene/phytoene synthase family protein, partial [Gammaproteobacteria bacterium]|nr:squalene/phytoene synthase family protein [Gammaproteobacteria bacterium]
MQYANDDALQDYFLQGVSRTFALTIPVLPMPLQRVVANAYLQCRIIDTIEDDPGLSLDKKRKFAQDFVQCLSGEAEAGAFAKSLYPQLSDNVLDMEKELVRANAEV